MLFHRTNTDEKTILAKANVQEMGLGGGGRGKAIGGKVWKRLVLS